MKKILILVLSFLATSSLTFGASNLWEYHKEKGLEFPSFEERKEVFENEIGNEIYLGTAGQNKDYLDYLAGFSDVKLGAGVYYPTQGGTGTSTAPTYGQMLVGNSGGTYTLTATSSLGISGAGEINTASTLGTGLNLYDSKSGVDLRFNSVAAGTNITLSTSTNSNTIVINSTGGGAFAWTTTTNYGALANATNTPIWFQSGLQASSTAKFVYASTTALTVSGNSYLGTVSSGIWNGTTIGTNYGGTGQDFSASTGLVKITSGTASTVATSSLTLTNFPANIPTTLGALVGGSNTTWNYWGLATTSQPASSNILTSNGTSGVYGTATSTIGAGTGLTFSGTSGYQVGGTNGTFSVNTSQNIATLSNLTSNGFVKTSGGVGTLSVDTSTYLTGNQTITLSGDVSGSGATAITATIGLEKILGKHLATSTAFADNDILTWDFDNDGFIGLTCAEITGSAGLCDGTDDTGAGGSANWLKQTNYGVLNLTASTTIPYWAKSAIYASSTLTVATSIDVVSTTATSTFWGAIAMGTSTANSMLEVNGSIHAEEQILATSTSMSVDYCSKNTSNHLKMGVGSANITLTFTNYALCPGKKIYLSVWNPNVEPVGSTTITATLFRWGGYTSPGNNVTLGGMDRFELISTNGTSTPFIWGELDSTLP